MQKYAIDDRGKRKFIIAMKRMNENAKEKPMNKTLATTAFLLTVWLVPQAASAASYAKFQDIEGSSSRATPVGIIGTKNCKRSIVARGNRNIHRATAYQSALQKWAAAVDLRFGHPYSFWSKAKQKNTSCARVVGKWICKARAKPCR